MRGVVLHVMISLAGLAGVSACTEVRETSPERTANEQLLISTAADEAIERLNFGLPQDAEVYLETRYLESYDRDYVIAALRSEVAKQSAALVSNREEASHVVEVRAGALSTNKRTDYVGFGGFEVPVPFSEAVTLPLASLYKDYSRTGIAKLAATTYAAESGALVHAAGPVYGLSWVDRNQVLGVGWWDNNLLPRKIDEEMRPRSMRAE